MISRKKLYENLARAVHIASPHPAAIQPGTALKFRALEPRYLYDASVPVVVAETANAASQADSHSASADSHEQEVNALVAALTQAPAAAEASGGEAPPVAPPNAASQAPATAGESLEAPPATIVFIDSKIENAAELIGGLGPNVEVHVIQPDQNGMELIAETLAAHQGDVAGVHIFAHGAEGRLSIGNTDLTAETLSNDYAAIAQQWSGAFTADADILIYGCSVAAGASGQILVDMLAQLTGADVAASTDATGAATRGGNWDLEYRTGDIEQANPLSAQALAHFDALLAAPVVTSTQTSGTSIGILEGASATITQISVNDADGGNLTVTVSAAHGTVSLNGIAGLSFTAGDGTSDATMTFSGTIAAINAALNGMTYTGNPGSGATDDFTGNDAVTVLANDGSSTHSASVNVSITPVNDVPQITVNAVSVNEGGNVTFSTAVFSALDPDNVDAQIIYKLESLPTHGLLTLNGNPVVVGTVFDQTMIGQLVYTHDGTQVLSTGTDTFTFSVEDGAGGIVGKAGGAITTPVAVNITLNPVNQAPTITGEVNVYEGETGHAISVTITDPDQTGAHTLEITSLPSAGVLKFNGVAVTVGQQFSSSQISQLTYDASPNEPSGPVTFGIKAIDDGGGTGVPANGTGTVTLNILLNNDDPVLAVNTGATVASGTSTIDITTAKLQVTDPDSGDANLTYTVTDLPQWGQLQIFQGGQWRFLQVGSVFTQQDIDDGLIRYEYTGGAPFVGAVDNFNFTVKDGGIRAWPTQREGGIYADETTTTLSDLQFDITVNTVLTGSGAGGGALPANTAPTAFTTNDVTVSEGGTATISNTDLNVTDADTPAAQLVYRMMTLSPNGTLMKNGTALGLFDSFTQADIDNGLISYQHNGSENFNTSNNFVQFTVSDGKNVSTTQTIRFDVTPVNDQPTAEVLKTPVVSEGGTTLINNTVLTLADVDGSGDKSGSTSFSTTNSLTFTITNLPAHGTLLLDADGNGSFETTVNTSTVITKAQLDGGRLQYQHDGSENFTDSFDLVVNDNKAQGNSLSSTYTVNIKAAPLNDPPVQSERKDMVLEEGGTGTIKGSNGTAGDDFRLVYTDPDSTVVQRQYRITDNVDFGTLFLSGKALGVGSVFTQDDLDNNRITYKHNGSENHADTFSFTVRDGAGGAVNGSYDITITDVNDAPTLTVPGTQTATGSTHVFSTANGNAITYADPDSVNPGFVDTYTITLDIQDGGTTSGVATLTLASTSGLTITNGTNGSGKFTITGTKADVDAALNGLTLGGLSGDLDKTLQLVVTLTDVNPSGTPANNGGPDPAGAAANYNVVTKTININASNVNDPPVITQPSSVTAVEDTNFSFTGGNTISVADVDSFGSNISVTLAVQHGTLTLGTTTGVTFSGGANGDATYTITGTRSAVNTALASLVYKGSLDFNGSDTLQIDANDGGNTGSSGGTGTDSQTVSITVSKVNDAPTLTAPAGPILLNTASPVVFSTANSNAISFDDAKDIPFQLDTTLYHLTLTTKDAGNNFYGQISLGTTSGVTVVSGANGSSSMVLEGTKADLNAALQGLSFTPDSNNGDLAVTLTVLLDDQANGGAGALTATKSLVINVSGANDAPVVTMPAPQSVNEDTPLVFNSANGNLVSVNDPDDFGAIMEATVSVSHGTLTLGSTSGLTFTAGDGTSDATMTFRGTEAQINAALAGLTYQGVLNYNGSDTLSVSLNDLGNTGIGGAQTTTQTVAITVNPVNDTPAVTVPGAQTVAEDTNLVFSTGTSNAISFADVDVDETGGTGLMTVTLSVSHGTLALASGSGVTVTSGADGSASMVISGTMTQITAAVNGLKYLADANYSGSDTLTVLLNDSGNTGSDPGLTGSSTDERDSKTIAITVTAVNDAPSITKPGPQEVNEDTPLVFSAGNSNAVSFGDVDADPATTVMTATLSVSHGTLTLKQTSGLTFSAGDGTSDGTMTFTGTLNAINAAIATLTYQGVLNYNGADTLSLTMSDGGATGAGGSQSTTQTVAITVHPVNDTPAITAPGTTQSVNEDNPLTFGTANSNAISFADVDDEGSSMSVTLSVSHGGITIASGSGVAVTGGANGGASVTIQGTKAQINAAMEGLIYRPNSNYNGTDALVVELSDDGHTGIDPGLTGTSTDERDSKTINILVNPIDDAPTVSAPATIQAPTVGQSFSFTGTTGVSIDDIDAASGNMTVTLRVTDGTLKLTDTSLITGGADGSTTITLTGTVTQINTALGGLSYTGKTVGFEDHLVIDVNDNSNTGAGGPLSASATVTMVVQAAPVQDPPPSNDPPQQPPQAPPVAPPVPPTPVPLTDPRIDPPSTVTGPTVNGTPTTPVTTFGTGDQQIGGAPLLVTDFRASFYSLPLNPVALSATLQDRVVGDQVVENFQIPASAFRHTDPSQQISKEATLPDGSPLPNYISFNPQTGEFTVQADAARAQGIRAVDVKVIGRDQESNSASAQFRILLSNDENEGGQQQGQQGPGDQGQAPAQQAPGQSGNLPDEMQLENILPGEGRVQSAQAEAPVAKPSLAEQLRHFGRAGFESESRALAETLGRQAA